MFHFFICAPLLKLLSEQRRIGGSGIGLLLNDLLFDNFLAVDNVEAGRQIVERCVEFNAADGVDALTNGLTGGCFYGLYACGIAGYDAYLRSNERALVGIGAYAFACYIEGILGFVEVGCGKYQIDESCKRPLCSDGVESRVFDVQYSGSGSVFFCTFDLDVRVYPASAGIAGCGNGASALDGKFVGLLG